MMGAPSTIRNHLEEVRQLVAEGWSGASIAAKYDCSPSTAIAFMAAHGLRCGSSLNATPEEIRAHKEAGKSDRALAVLYKVHHRQIYNFRAEHGIPANTGCKVGSPNTAGDVINQSSREIRSIVVKVNNLVELYGGRTYQDSSVAARPEPKWRPINIDWAPGGRTL